ncbi:MAG: hypothetical protein AB7S78_01325 [Candidatus Omnitrophota bacterium]
MQNKQRISCFIITVLTFILTASNVRADCDITPAYEETFVVNSCRALDPYAVKTLMVYLERYPLSFVESQRDIYAREAQIAVDAYRGAVLESRVTRGQPVRYLFQDNDPAVCARFPAGSTVTAEITGACCDGDINPPCYLGFRNLLTGLISVTDEQGNPVTPPEPENEMIYFE